MKKNLRTFTSIIIPVFNDLKRLTKCLDALSSQSYPQELFDVIVVDNNSSEDVQAVVNSYDFTIYSFEPQRGSYAARNKGISIARGEIIGFTDSDCIPAPNWIEKGVENFLKTPNCGLVAGQIKFYFQDAKRPTLAELYDSSCFLNQEKYINKEHYGATANLFTSASVFKKVGLFNSSLKSGGDREWGKRVFSMGYSQIYASDVLIEHPARVTIKELKSKLIRVVEGQYESTKAERRSLTDSILNCLWDAKPSLRRIYEILFAERQSRAFHQKLGIVYVYIILRYQRAVKRLMLDIDSLK